MNRTYAIACALLMTMTALPARATGEIEGLITEADRQRLADYDLVREEALAEAHTGQPDEQTAILDEVVSAVPQPWQGMALEGDWRCRTIKAGGLAQLVVYGWFKCRVTDDGSGWMLQKLTGSQRTKGRFFDESDTRMTYLGSFAVNDDPFPAYGSGPDSDQAGYAFRLGDDWWRIEFPSPRYELKLDIIEFRR